MKVINYEGSALTYQYRGYVWNVSQEAIIDTLNHQGIDIINYMRSVLDNWPMTEEPRRVRLSISRDVSETGDWMSNTLKITRCESVD